MMNFGSSGSCDELKVIIHEAISEDMEVWRETFEIMAGGRH